MVKGNMLKNGKEKIIIICLILILICISYLVLNLILKPKYEFYDLDGNPGISTNCKIVEEGLVCEVKNQFVPVGQYSKIE